MYNRHQWKDFLLYGPHGYSYNNQTSHTIRYYPVYYLFTSTTFCESAFSPKQLVIVADSRMKGLPTFVN